MRGSVESLGDDVWLAKAHVDDNFSTMGAEVRSALQVKMSGLLQRVLPGRYLMGAEPMQFSTSPLERGTYRHRCEQRFVLQPFSRKRQTEW